MQRDVIPISALQLYSTGDGTRRSTMTVMKRCTASTKTCFYQDTTQLGRIVLILPSSYHANGREALGPLLLNKCSGISGGSTNLSLCTAAGGPEHCIATRVHHQLCASASPRPWRPDLSYSWHVFLGRPQAIGHSCMDPPDAFEARGNGVVREGFARLIPDQPFSCGLLSIIRRYILIRSCSTTVP